MCSLFDRDSKSAPRLLEGVGVGLSKAVVGRHRNKNAP